jgi:hypothetical protein
MQWSVIAPPAHRSTTAALPFCHLRDRRASCGFGIFGLPKLLEAVALESVRCTVKCRTLLPGGSHAVRWKEAKVAQAPTQVRAARVARCSVS